jgi:D-xylulose reductase
MKALVLHEINKISIDDIDIKEEMGPEDVKIAMKAVGICGSDIHYYKNGKIGGFVVKEPMVLGHEASGTVVEAGVNVKGLKPGDRVCMEPGIPDPGSRATMLGIYNLDPEVRFWATPPVHGCLRETVVHPAMFTFKLPDNLGFDEGALIEPMAIGLHAATKAGIKPGDTALVAGCGTIGLVTALAALSAGCSRVIITDIKAEKLELAKKYGITTVHAASESVVETVKELTDGWGVDVIFEATGNEKVIADIFTPLCPGGTVVLIGMPVAPAPIDVVAAQTKEACIKTIFRYAHMYPRAVALAGSGKIDLKPLVTDRFSFSDSIKAFEYAANPRPDMVKTMIEL